MLGEVLVLRVGGVQQIAEHEIVRIAQVARADGGRSHARDAVPGRAEVAVGRNLLEVDRLAALRPRMEKATLIRFGVGMSGASSLSFARVMPAASPRGSR